MARIHEVDGYDNFLKKMLELNNEQDVYIYYCGSIGKDVWCDDCVRAWPKIKNAYERFLNRNAHFVYVSVGGRLEWTDWNNVFRKDTKTHLTVLPTLAKWKGQERLEGDQCEKIELLELLFSDE